MKLKQNLDEMLYSLIIDSLILHEYEMGEQISLDSLATKYGVSRTPVLQAVRLLSSDGVLELMPNGRVRVPMITADQKYQIIEVRSLIESYALNKLFINKKASVYDKYCQNLKKISEESHLYTMKNDLLNFNRADLKFHREIIKGSENDFLSELYKKIQGRFVIANYLGTNWTADDFQRADHAHASIVNALIEHDEAKANELLREHINTTYSK
ncbi:MAG: GntR family transcriptional regulator [Lachnospiraceae bacterium]|nr:GntR family transcriptional regulator [Lachnospiraceae bacterium]